MAKEMFGPWIDKDFKNVVRQLGLIGNWKYWVGTAVLVSPKDAAAPSLNERAAEGKLPT